MANINFDVFKNLAANNSTEMNSCPAEQKKSGGDKNQTSTGMLKTVILFVGVVSLVSGFVLFFCSPAAQKIVLFMTIGGLWAIFILLVLFAVIQVIKKCGDKGQAENNHQQVAKNEIGFVSCSDSRDKDHSSAVTQFCAMDETLSLHAAIVLYGSELRSVDTASLLDFFSKKKLREKEVYENLSPADLGELRTILDAQLRFGSGNVFQEILLEHYKGLIEKQVMHRIKALFLNQPTAAGDCETKFMENFVELFQLFDQATCQLELLEELKTYKNLWEKLIAGKNFLAGLKAALSQSFDTLYAREVQDCYAILGLKAFSFSCASASDRPKGKLFLTFS